MYLYRIRRADCIGCLVTNRQNVLSILLYPQMLIYSF
jgi:hypothetical protein